MCVAHYVGKARAASASGSAANAAGDVTKQGGGGAPACLCDRGKGKDKCCRRAGHGGDVGHDYDKKRRERVVSRILLLMARPGQTTGPLRAVGRAGDAIWWVWWALHGLRCSSGAYAHI